MMVVLYNSNKKEYVKYIRERKRSDFTSDASDATVLTEDEADALLQRCSKKLKGFSKISENIVSSAEANQSCSEGCTGSDGENVVVIKVPRRSFTKQEKLTVYTRYQGTCGICGNFVPPNEMTIDHIIPISKGGTYDLDNLQCCCKKCNQIKADILPEDFLDKMIQIIGFQADSGNDKAVKGIKMMAKGRLKKKKKDGKRKGKKKKK